MQVAIDALFLEPGTPAIECQVIMKNQQIFEGAIKPQSSEFREDGVIEMITVGQNQKTKETVEVRNFFRLTEISSLSVFRPLMIHTATQMPLS